MKRSLLWVLMGVPVLTFAQQKYTVEVKTVQPGPAVKAYLSYQDGDKSFKDSAAVTGGTFHFTGTVTEPVQAQLYLSNPGSKTKDASLLHTTIWLERGTIKVSATDPLSPPVITGGQMNTDYAELQKKKIPAFARMAEASKVYTAATDEQRNAPGFMKHHQEVYLKAMEETSVFDSLYIRSHPNSFLSLYLVSGMVSNRPAHTVLIPMLNSFGAEVRNSASAKKLYKTLGGMSLIEPGAKAPDFTISNTEGKPVSLSSFKGKYVLIDFWASWCVPCRKENPNVKAAYEKFKDKNFTVVGISLDKADGKEAWLKAIKDDQLEWTQLSELKDFDGAVVKLYDVSSIPRNVLVSPQGIILAKNLRGEALQQWLTKLIR
ncbi:MAG TPA: TlpA disulfide reductase family protein [Pedobacter sp.]